MLPIIDRLIANARAKLITGAALGVAGVFALVAAFCAVYGGFEMLVPPPFAAALAALSFAIVIAVAGLIIGGMAANKVPARPVRSNSLPPGMGVEIGTAVIGLLADLAAERRRKRQDKARRRR